MLKTTFEQLRQGNLGELFAVLEAELTAQGIDFYLIGGCCPRHLAQRSPQHRAGAHLDLTVLLASGRAIRPTSAATD